MTSEGERAIRENERSRRSPDQIIRFAAAITIPVTKAAKQENSRRSSNTALVIGITPVLNAKVPG